jgi:hypothetical protein
MGTISELATLNPEQLPAGSSPALRAALERRSDRNERDPGFNSFINPV